MNDTLSNRIAQWSAGFSIEILPPPAVALVKRAFLDTLAVTLLGSRLDGPRIVADIELARGAAPAASIHGMGGKTDLLSAALINGTSAHAELFDDNSVPMIAHPSSPLVSALLPLAQVHDLPGRSLIEAYSVGFEVGVALGRAANPALYEKGWHVTRVLGVVGATAACCRLLGLPLERTVAALGIAATMASGLRQNFGTMTMGLHVGLTARDAVHATLLAQSGMSADAAGLDGKYGLFPTFSPHAFVPPDFGRPLELMASGITFKPYPSGAPTHAAVDAALALRARPGFDAARITHITCLVHPWNAMTLREEEPCNTLQARVNMRYCVAAAMLYGELTFRQFDDSVLGDPALTRLMQATAIEMADGLPDNGEFPAELRVQTQDGNTWVERRDVPPGGSSRPLADSDIIAKFESCASVSLSAETTEHVIGMVLGLDGLASAAPLCESLEGRPCGKQT
ncbi:MmgE/PrpD family protein [Bordetella sp. BOR01]|uniref:MmgE/PrpD family protein n=1 Tax=Bordetella sp. BOR01 TaxID=2854779 RepID=UPI001C45C207|nr:MmgE/PrpD family protein [Bordetella sp. BOR01]MBV7483216.1 MmgE/PrpD family protein [Bordetella sp. BOR01]